MQHPIGCEDFPSLVSAAAAAAPDSKCSLHCLAGGGGESSPCRGAARTGWCHIHPFTLITHENATCKEKPPGSRTGCLGCALIHRDCSIRAAACSSHMHALSRWSWLESFNLSLVLPGTCTKERRGGCTAGAWLGRGSTLLCASISR